MASDLEPYENITRVFWIKIELKDVASLGKQDLGDIRDVMSGVRSPIRGLFDIIKFIVPYIIQMGIRVSWFWRFMVWLYKIDIRKYAHGIILDHRTRKQ